MRLTLNKETLTRLENGATQDIVAGVANPSVKWDVCNSHIVTGCMTCGQDGSWAYCPGGSHVK